MAAEGPRWASPIHQARAILQASPRFPALVNPPPRQATHLELHLMAPPLMDPPLMVHPLALVTSHPLEDLHPRQGRVPSFPRAPSSLTPLATPTLLSSAASIRGQPPSSDLALSALRSSPHTGVVAMVVAGVGAEAEAAGVRSSNRRKSSRCPHRLCLQIRKQRLRITT